MLVKISKTFSVSLLGLLCVVSTLVSAVSAEELPGLLDETVLDEVGEYWSPLSTSLATNLENDASAETAEEGAPDDAVTPVQMLARQRGSSRPTRMALRPQRTSLARRSASVGLASVPFMIGDTGAGTCLSFGGLLDVDLAHPTLACSRLNISEANTPLPTDRFYYSYRHFQNATPTRVFQFEENFNIDRHTLGGERTFFNKMLSFEVRVPIENRLNSEIGTYAVNPASPTLFPGRDTISGLNGKGDRRVELGNISMIFKALLFEQETFAISAGLGVTLPTARDVSYRAVIDEFVTFVDSPVLARYQIVLASIASNETIYLAPFLSWIWQEKDSRFFHQGFLQVEVAANDSFFTVDATGIATFDISGDGVPNPFDPADDFITFQTIEPFGGSKIQAQTLMRLNLGFGYVLSENQQADWIQKLTGIFEVHYTSTLNDANLHIVPLDLGASIPVLPGFDRITVGNRDNRVDIVNAVVGLSADMGNWVITHGATAPLKKDPNRGFDFEYNMQIQRPF